jgi:hypothetical protein
MGQVENMIRNMIWKSKLCLLVLYPWEVKVREVGGQEEQRRLRRNGDNISATPWPRRVCMTGAGREQLPSCGWEAFPVSLPGGSLIIIYPPQAAQRPAREQHGAEARAQSGSQKSWTMYCPATLLCDLDQQPDL